MRIALHTRVRADRVDEYERAHAAVPAELTDAIRAAGATSWTIWRSGTDLFHLIDCADYAAMLAALSASQVNAAMRITYVPNAFVSPGPCSFCTARHTATTPTIASIF